MSWPRRLMTGVLPGPKELTQPVASLLLALMHHDQEDDALAASAVRALAHLCDNTHGYLIQHLVGQLPLQLLKMGLGRLSALNSSLESAASALPDWLETFLCDFIRVAQSLHVICPWRCNNDGVLSAVLEALAPSACSMAYRVAHLLSAGAFDEVLMQASNLLLTHCANRIPSRSRSQCICSMLPKEVPSIAALARSAAALVVGLEHSFVELSPSLSRKISTLFAAILEAGARFAAAQCSNPACQQRTQVEPTDAAPCPAGSSASVTANDASLQQLRQAADGLTIGTYSANALVPEDAPDDLRTAALRALATLHGSGAIFRAAAAAVPSDHAAPATQVPEAVAESPPRTLAAAEAPAPVETAHSSAYACLSLPAEQANAQASASPLPLERLEPPLATQEHTAGSDHIILLVAKGRASFIWAAVLAARVRAKHTMASIPHVTVLKQLEALLGLISDATGHGWGWCGGPGPSHYEALLLAPARALQWIHQVKNDLPEVRCPSSPLSTPYYHHIDSTEPQAHLAFTDALNGIELGQLVCAGPIRKCSWLWPGT